jgi:virginiamycin B lyase
MYSRWHEQTTTGRVAGRGRPQMRLSTKALAVVAGLALVLGATLTSAQAANLFRYKAYKVPTANSEPRYITEGPDGNMWWVGSGEVFTPNPDPDTGGTFTSNIGRITPGGDITEFPVDCGGCLFDDIASGPGNQLFVSNNSAGLWTITTDGVVDFVLPQRADGSPVTYALGPLTSDGDDLWGATSNIPVPGEPDVRGIWRYDVPTGEFTEFVVSGAVGEVVVDAQGLVWFTAESAIGRFDPATGATATAPVPDEITPGGQPATISSLVVASDGNVWFTDRFNHAVGHLDPANSSVKQFATLTPEAGPQDIAAADDGSVWFAQARVGNVARVTPDGVITEAGKAVGDDPRSGLEDALGVAVRPARVGPDGAEAESVWFTMQAANKIASVTAR